MRRTGRRCTTRAGLLALAAAAHACAEAGSGPLLPPDGPGEPGEPVTLEVVGLGAVAQRFTAEVAVRGDRAYTTTWGRRNGNPGDVLYVWDVSGDVPARLDSATVAGAGTLGDVQVSDDGSLLMVAMEPGTTDPTGAVLLYDLDGDGRPTLLLRHHTPSVAPGVHTAKFGRVGGVLHAFLSVLPTGHLVILDLGEPAEPVEVLVRRMGQPFVHDVFVRDELLFTALWDDGLSIWDLGGAGLGGSPSDPVLVGNVRTVNGNVHNVWWFHDPGTGSKRYAFVGEESFRGVQSPSAGDIHVVDVSAPGQPREVAVYDVPNAGTHNFWMDEQRGILYAAYYNGGVRALDVRGDLDACQDDARRGDGRCDLRLMGRELAVALTEGDPFVWGVVHQGSHVYASDMRQGLFKLDAAPLVR